MICNLNNSLNIIFLNIKKTFLLYFVNFFKSSIRANRKEYLFLTLLLYFLNYTLGLCSSTFIDNHYILALLSIVIIYFPSINLIIRRLHDLNTRGWLWFIILSLCVLLYLVWLNSNTIYEHYELISIVLIILVNAPLLVIKGTDGPNRYGEPPKN